MKRLGVCPHVLSINSADLHKYIRIATKWVHLVSSFIVSLEIPKGALPSANNQPSSINHQPPTTTVF